MSAVLTKRNSEFIRRVIREGKYNNQSEVIRAALNRLEQDDASYLNPPRIPDKVFRRIYREMPAAERRIERAAARASNIKPKFDE